MKNIIINENDAHQRLDRFLRKYMPEAQLSYIYKAIRKDIKVNGKRVKNDTMLEAGDNVTIYISDEKLAELIPEHKYKSNIKRRSFSIAYEDNNMIVVVKPAGLLTHGDRYEKKNTLVNQVTDYLIETGAYLPRIEKTFSPAAVNRLDRNTSGLVIFGKNSAALRSLSELVRNREGLEKYYIAIVEGKLNKELHLVGNLVKDESRNLVKIDGFVDKNKSEVQNNEVLNIDKYNGNKNVENDDTFCGSKRIETIVKPLVCEKGLSLVEVQLITGRTHQIRAHMAKAGYPLIGDKKYGRLTGKENNNTKLHGQLLHAYKLRFISSDKNNDMLYNGDITALPQGKSKKLWKSFFPNLESYIDENRQ